MWMENFTCCMKNFLKSKYVCCIEILYVAWKNFVKIPCSSQNFMHIKFYMHHVKTCKKCQATYKNLQNFYATSTKDVTATRENIYLPMLEYHSLGVRSICMNFLPSYLITKILTASSFFVLENESINRFSLHYHRLSIFILC